MLKTPLWLRIVDAILMIGVPAIITGTEIAYSSSVKYKISFFSILVVVIAWMFFSKFVINNYKTKLQSSVTTLELNYNTGVGDKTLTLKLWKKHKLILIILNAITILLGGSVFYLVIYGLAKGLLKFLGASIIIALCYFLSFIIKAIYLATRKVEANG